MENKIGYLYRCEECSYEKRLKSKYRGIDCIDCKKGVMKIVDE